MWTPSEPVRSIDAYQQLHERLIGASGQEPHQHERAYVFTDTPENLLQ